MFTSKPCHFLLKTKGEGVPENFPKTLSRDGAPGETRTHTGRDRAPAPGTPASPAIPVIVERVGLHVQRLARL